ncbi:DnaJ-domain-containing protein [Tricholoma matsutake]|nr:DnaJ-domain-containing protein [Tricholoma matsutake 945]
MLSSCPSRLKSLSFSVLPTYCTKRNRPFSSTCPNDDHYKTLGVQHNATKAQIKSHFYQLSKKHHPDVSDDSRSKEIFRAVSEAYAILSNDRERRAYDRTLLSQPPRTSSSSHTYHPRAPPTRSGPRSSATYAWEYPSHPRRSQQNPGSSAYNHPHHGPQQHKHPHSEQSQNQRFSPHLDFRGTPRRKAEEEERAIDRVRNESGLKRALQLIGLLAVSMGVFGGWGGGR